MSTRPLVSIVVSAISKLKVTQKLLGQASVTTTANIYAHVPDEDLRKAVVVLEEASWKAIPAGQDRRPGSVVTGGDMTAVLLPLACRFQDRAGTTVLGFREILSGGPVDEGDPMDFIGNPLIGCPLDAPSGEGAGSYPAGALSVPNAVQDDACT